MVFYFIFLQASSGPAVDSDEDDEADDKVS